MERSFINYWFHARATLALGSAVVHKHTSCSVRVKDFYRHRCIKTANI